MRLWTLHPRHLDAKGLVALWREALLAQKVLRGATKGYLTAVHEEATRREYKFDASKIGPRVSRRMIPQTRGQLPYEWRHLKRKLKLRDPMGYRAALNMKAPAAHPLFRIVAGRVRDWERRSA